MRKHPVFSPRRLSVLVVLGLFFAAALPSAAQVASIDYLQGWVDLRYPSGDVVEAMIGDELEKDDTVITGDDGTATLARQGAAEIVINPNTVFSIREIDSGGQKETIMHTALGSVKFKFMRLFGIEPKISTPSSVAGVRGTEFTVYAGDEGSALFTVDSGEVMVTSQGIPVVLYEGEGVEVKAGRAPGEKFELKGRPIDYSSWADEKQAEFSADPIAGLRGIERQMDGYIREVENLEYAFAENNVLYEDLKKQFNEIKENLGDEEATKFLQEKVTPVGHQESIIFSNLRYFALTAFSLKRYVMASQFSLIKAQSLVNKNDETFKDFMAIYDRIILKIEDRIFNFLVQNDI
ncbi:FecR family protein [Marispirochaeta aestuarii]|uniref:FecR family protein n=1 Tax=Marispirochaeta aestuarii TaxID=1963862 RepID=UPI0029C67B53|nr:FecR family protein [Marispirochaeta aestuarii]